MKLCFCRLLLAVAIAVLAIFWWTETWAQWVIIGAAVLLALMSLFYTTCCCATFMKKEEG
jgi:membrane protein YdbS with pleckstrin-like domain